MALDLHGFDPRGFKAYVDACAAAGVRLDPWVDTAANRSALHELDRICSADLPDHGPVHDYEEYVEQRIEVPTFRAAGVIVAVTDDGWVGFTATSLHPPSERHPQGFALSEMTGVLAEHRGRGISVALKLRAVAFARQQGVPVLRTVHHRANAAAIAMNRRLGFLEER